MLHSVHVPETAPESYSYSHRPLPKTPNKQTNTPPPSFFSPSPPTLPTPNPTHHLLLRPITPLRNHLRKPLQPPPIHLIEPIHRGAVDVDNRHHSAGSSPGHDDGHDDLAAARPVARDVARERVDVGHELRLRRRRRRAAHPAPEGDGLACHLALEGTEDELGAGGRGRGVEGVEACFFLVGVELVV